MRCSMCQNEDETSFGITKRGEFYCKKCISFRGKEVSDFAKSDEDDRDFSMPFKLNKLQEEISKQMLENFLSGFDTLLWAVCGSGKTEITYKTIAEALRVRKIVCFTIPRREVVIELKERLSRVFKGYNVTALYGGHNDDVHGELICCTTHQLYRFNKTFDLTIIDEVDAFPYRDNDVLEAFLKRSNRGNYIYLTSTPSEKLLSEFSKPKKKILKLFSRHHLKPMPLPKKVLLPGFLSFIYLLFILFKYKKHDKKCLIFVGTIAKSLYLSRILSKFYDGVLYLNSKVKERAKVIKKFRSGECKFLVTTSVLERGVTFKDINVVIYACEDSVFDEATLIQMAGRAGRVKGYEEGKVIFISRVNKKGVDGAIDFIEQANETLSILSK
jgi:competence protein ComFA